MIESDDSAAQNEPRDSHDTVERQAVPSRWLGIGAGLMIALLFALYALDDPYPYIVFPIVGLGVVFAAARGTRKPDIPAAKVNFGALVPVTTVMLFVFFGSIIARRIYDIPWLPIAAGLLVGLVVFLLNEHARRTHPAQSTK